MIRSTPLRLETPEAELVTPQSIKEGSQGDILESVNRARHAFGDFIERWKDRLILKGNSSVENYHRGRMALVLHCNCSSPVKLKTVGTIREIGLTIREKDLFFLVLKADIGEPHQIEDWNKQLMLVPNVHIVQGPQGVIPGLVGFYDIHDDISNLKGARIVGKSLLFQSAFYGTYKFLPLVKDWEPRPLVCEARSLDRKS